MTRILGVLLWCLLLSPSVCAEGGHAAVEQLRRQINAGTGQPSVVALESLWRSLQQLSTAQLTALSRSGHNNYFEQGWFELARDYRLTPANQRMRELERWRRDWFHHPAVAWLPYLISSGKGMAVPEQIRHMGVLLPLSGKFARQGKEVLAGVRAALEWDRRQGYRVPELEVFDSAGVRDVTSLLNVVAAGRQLDLLLGPLESHLTSQLTTEQVLPVLALNRVGGGRFNGYQLDLASDQELRQLMERMRRDGHRRILLLAPADEGWVEPLLEGIEQQARIQGMMIRERLRYGGVPEQLRQQIGQVLGIEASRQRAERLQALLGTPLKQEVRRRQDLDAVLLIARPEPARLIKPMLDYHQALDLPVYAGSHLFAGRVNPLLDRDLEGIVFCDMPWRLRPRPGRSSSSRFFALGVDAGSVYKALSKMAAGTPGYFEGETGRLRLVEGWRLQRSLPCARFVQGVPRPIPDAD